ncbi:glutamyl-tRNA reductase [Nocardioides sp. R-C-SC26]|uniref:glutamyl-tRNA reductase n=1 Tax=Nocardioides sp. R-C-SC26 TaxID=2870414 RepID=UPI001E2963EF|nr:glutamyl-tRNA reductase [Nocardioides sp. R-C-SC26]
MSILVVGISHKSAPVALLEQVAVDADGAHKLMHDAATCPHVSESAVIATCNRIEIYAEVDRFHGSVESLSRLLLERADISAEELLPHLYVHYDDGAVAHLFRVAAGLDSMALGEGQILGQTREALRTGQEYGAVGPSLNVLFQQALRVGKRTRAETGIDTVAPTLVSAALDQAAVAVGPVAGARVLVVGAGAMAGLAVATVTRLGARDVVVLNRTPERADRLAREYGARPAALLDLPLELATADIVITCAGARGLLITREMVAAARQGTTRPLALVDVALPHDVDPAVVELDKVLLVGLAELAAQMSTAPVGAELAEVGRIVEEEVTAFLTARRQASVAPTVVALRTMATAVVDAELSRLDTRLPHLPDPDRDEIRRAVRRVVDKLLHEPTVRVKELAGGQGAISYERALAELFALDPDAVSAVTRPGVGARATTSVESGADSTSDLPGGAS